MRWPIISHIVGALLVCIGLSMAIALGFSLYYNDAGITPLLASIGITVAAGVLFTLIGKRPSVKAP